MIAAFFLGLASPIPSGPPATAATPCAIAVSSNSADVFGADIEDRALLRFIRILATADDKLRAAATSSARIPLAPDVVSSIAAALVPIPCGDSIASLATSRMAIAISQNWAVSNDADADRLTARIQAIANALVGRRTLDAATVDALIAPFGTTLQALTAPPALPETCPQQTEAHVVRARHPHYPAAARVVRQGGRVLVKVELDEDGDVKRATIYRDTLSDGAAADSLREASLVAAATSLFAPEIQGCKPVSGSYLFASEFKAR